jgi:DNA-binding transcriptional ArsR family regulator
MSTEQQNTLIAMLQQVVESQKPRKPPPKRFNPRPPGVIQPGSATEAVYDFLAKAPGLKTEAQIVWATKRTHSAVSWSLLRLRSWGKIEAINDPSRNSRYMRYRLKVEKGEPK